MSCSNLFSSAATRFASRDLMASWEWESWTTLQITVLSSSLAGIFFDAIEVFPPSTTMLTIAKRMDRTRRQTTMERILSSDDCTSFRIAFENVVKSLWLAVFLDCLYMCTVYNRLLWPEHKIFSCQLLLPITLSHFVVYSRFRCCCNWSTSKLGLSLQNGSGQNSLDQSSSLKLNISILLRRDAILYSRTNFMCKCIEIVDIRFSYSNTFQCKYTLLVLKLINYSSTHYKHKIITMQQTYSCAHKDILEIRCDCNAYTVSTEENNPFRPGNLHN